MSKPKWGFGIQAQRVSGAQRVVVVWTPASQEEAGSPIGFRLEPRIATPFSFTAGTGLHVS